MPFSIQLDHPVTSQTMRGLERGGIIPFILREIAVRCSHSDITLHFCEIDPALGTFAPVTSFFRMFRRMGRTDCVSIVIAVAANAGIGEGFI